MEYRERYEGWLNDPYFDEATKEELRSIASYASLSPEDQLSLTGQL